MHEGEVRLLDGAIAELGTEVASARLSQTQKKSTGGILGENVRLFERSRKVDYRLTMSSR